ncbi:MAG: RAD55 family ATPase [Thermoplasmata archaeon]
MTERLPEYCTLLIIGPPGVGKLGWILDATKKALENREKVVFVTLDLHPSEIRNSLLHFGVEPQSINSRQIFFVDSYSCTLGGDSAPQPSKGIYPIRKPSNIGEMHEAISKSVQELGRPARILFYSLTTAFLYNSVQTIVKFFQMLSSRVKSEYGSATFTLHEGVHENSTVHLLSSFVDGVIQMRFNEDLDREWRIHHLRGVSTSPRWKCFDVNKYAFITNPHGKRIESCLYDYEYEVKPKKKEAQHP